MANINIYNRLFDIFDFCQDTTCTHESTQRAVVALDKVMAIGEIADLPKKYFAKGSKNEFKLIFNQLSILKRDEW